MNLSKGIFAGTIALAFLVGCVAIMPPASSPARIESLTVQNFRSRGGTGKTYRITERLGTETGQRLYVDREPSIDISIPLTLRGQTFLETADDDRAAAPGSSNFLSFEVAQSSTVYVAHDTRITMKPDWLKSNFMDTGMQLRIGHAMLELYSNLYPRHGRVVLGSNIPDGGNDRNSMYLVIVATTTADKEAPTPPNSLQISCATAAVVGLRWQPSTDNTKIAGYRISRDGSVIATTFSTHFSDTSVAASTSYSYVVTAFDAAGNTADSPALASTTLPASSFGDAPYCSSTLITGMTWDWAGGFTQANGSDLWSTAWGDDGNVYTFFGDGGGFGGDNDRGRTSFGIAKITAPPPLTMSNAQNVYGGYASEHPSLLNGKASSIIAIDADFYAVAGIYRPTDTKTEYPHQPSGGPNHMEIAYSIGNAYSWQDSAWSFCSMQSTGKRILEGSFCPQGFVSYGRGNSGAADGYIYVFGMDAVSYWDDGHKSLPIHTYLARVPKTQIVDQSAYEYFAGLGANGDPIWSADTDRMQPVFSDRNTNKPGCSDVCTMATALEEAVYNPILKRYIAIAQGDYAAQTSFYEAPDPWGPWAVISYNNIDAASGDGGWSKLGTAAGGSLGVHIVNAWSNHMGHALWVTYSSNGKAPVDALFPPPGTAMDSFNLVSADLSVTAAQQ